VAAYRRVHFFLPCLSFRLKHLMHAA
jgi:hypothetical protein